MSYDISFRVKVEGADAYVDVGDCEANITWNVREIITRSTGLEWKNEENNGLCVDVIPKIRQGLTELQIHGDKYKPYESPNGWGTVSGTTHFFEKILEAWNNLCSGQPELIQVVTFWIM